jgi:hypothetical protein
LKNQTQKILLIDLDASKFDSARRLKVTPELTVVGEQVKTFSFLL